MSDLKNCFVLAATALTATGCASPRVEPIAALANETETGAQAEKYEIAHTSAQPGSEISWLGHRTGLTGARHLLQVGHPLPGAALTDMKMMPARLSGPGSIRLISVVPSLDTEVCDRQTHLLDASTLDKGIQRITISRDLPYAQTRYREEGKIKNIEFLSDYKAGDFGRQAGLQIERNHLLARAIIVVDQENIVRYLQITPEIYQLPDMAKAFAFANSLSKKDPAN
jgi:thiol peroxidase